MDKHTSQTLRNKSLVELTAIYNSLVTDKVIAFYSRVNAVRSIFTAQKAAATAQ